MKKDYIITTEWALFALLEEVDFNPKESHNCLGNLINSDDKDVIIFFQKAIDNHVKHTNKELQFERIIKYIDVILNKKIVPFKELENLKETALKKYKY